MRLKDCVSTPSSSFAGKAWRGLKSPCATAWVPSARISSGCASRRAISTATASAPSSASNRVRLSVTV